MSYTVGLWALVSINMPQTRKSVAGLYSAVATSMSGSTVLSQRAGGVSAR